jgi:TPR repeat protein
LYRDGNGVRQDYKQSRQLLEQAAEKNYDSAQYSLGLMYEKGLGMEKDYSQAMACYRKISDRGGSVGYYAIGALYVEGHGVHKDNEKATKYFKKAIAIDNNADAQTYLAYMYEKVLRVKENDSTKTLEWYTRASEQGSATAKLNIAIMHHDGRGVVKDYNEACEYFENAINGASKNFTAYIAIGDLYTIGGSEKNYVKAMEFYQKSAENNVSNAYYCIDTSAVRVVTVLKKI